MTETKGKQKILSDEMLSYILGLLEVEWIKKTEKICEHYFSTSKFNLAKYFIESLLIPIQIMRNDRSGEKFTYVSRNVNNLKKLIEKYRNKPLLFKKNIFKNPELKGFLQEFLKDTFTLSVQVKANELLDHCAKFLKSYSWFIAKPSKRNNHYSQTEFCVMKLAWIFHALTREMPEVRHNGSMEGTDEEYSGKFFEFLLEVKPLLAIIGIELVSSLGQYTVIALKEHKKKLSFLNIEIPPLE